ncbi:MAG: hypothetical protein PHN82_08995 [bacterium]|nr:hypothetical protein [bacterium]
MWWRWLLFTVCAISIVACLVSTTVDWSRGRTGPFGPHPENWWGCGLFTAAVGLVMIWLGKRLL